MARNPRQAPGGLAYHVMNRAAGRLRLFAHAADYQAFEHVLAQALARHPAVRLCAYCLMPTHFHLVLWPAADGQLSRFMQWLTMTHAARRHAHRRTGGRGHLYQSRFRAFPVQHDEHFLAVCRYVERNPLRAGLVAAAQDWPWGSLHVRRGRPTHASPLAPLLADWPVDHPPRWVRQVNAPQTPDELTALRLAVARGRPYGDDTWVTQMARALGLQSALRPRGRPRKRPAPTAAQPRAAAPTRPGTAPPKTPARPLP